MLLGIVVKWPHLRWEASSSGERRFNGGGAERAREGSRGGREIGRRGGEGMGWCGEARGCDS